MEEADLVENDIGVDDENGGRRSTEASTGRIANCAKRCAAVYIIAQIVLPHLLLPKKENKEEVELVRVRVGEEEEVCTFMTLPPFVFLTKDLLWSMLEAEEIALR